MSRKVTSPSGERWRVRRAWVPRLGHHSILGRFLARTRKIRKRVTDNGDISGCGDGCGAIDGLEALAIVALVVIVLLVAVFVVVPLVVAVIDIIILLVLAVLAFVARIVFRRPWVVEAHRVDLPDDEVELHRWSVVGWGSSGERVEQISQHIESGLGVPPPDA